MPFQLTISEGKDAGKEFVFDQDSVLIGRTSECDVVLYDPGVSRRHCRLFLDGDAYSVEDQGSANGTLLNGSAVQTQALEDGDKLTLGPVTFIFTLMTAESSTGEEELPAGAEDGANSTRIVSVDALKRQRNKGVALAPDGADENALEEMRQGATRNNLRALRPASGGASGSRAAVAASEPAAIERAGNSSPAPRRPARAESSAPVRARPQANAGASGLSAAERARIRRESPGLVASAKLFWADASNAVRGGVVGGGVAVVLGIFGLLYWLVLSGSDTGPVGEEPAMLTRQPIRDSFGLGPDVTWARADMKIFEWEYTAATRAVVILHYQAQGISKDEVMVSVNGVDVGKVPPDTLASQDRALEMMIPSQHLKKGEPNRIVFDNTKNPPGEDPWRIWNVWVESALLPELLPEELVRQATESYKRGRKNNDTPDIGARNRYEAWKSFREAWLMLEAHPEPKPDLYYEAQERMKVAQQELDRTCAKLLLEVEGYYNQGNYKGASATLDHVKQYFPEYDQPCATRAENKREEYGL
ncbi:FHA domain-containing protein [Myxococcus stipitatus DSM 14675]|uniref:FHA domain-containing protein n=1 Tax=Myxococcus stipitatus (strain DSM 14675 / JCM 12634 / Mx s8) TaxID=1278073 RepID=L7U8C2_MYXSD|nr:FHA domain-containing protein [Myxococcus stipitatus]AGC42729.1 FHA domain-containing protein [Myxococcus stipitatus DSM 14675]